MQANYEVLTNCVACDNSDLSQVLNLGKQALANEYLEKPKSRELFPLCIMVCRSCYHCQLSISVNPSRMFENYQYISSASDTMEQYFALLRNLILKRVGTSGKILDIGSNDGSFLAVFDSRLWDRLGVDPAVNLISESYSRGVLTIANSFNYEVANVIDKSFDVVTALNVFAHTSDPLSMLNAINLITHENSVIYIQTSQADMIPLGQFDTAYHEHISFFNVKSMKNLLSRANMYLSNVTIMPIHGNSYLWEVKKGNAKEIKILDRENWEVKKGIYQLETYDEFDKKSDRAVIDFQKKIEEFRLLGYKIVTYGAAAKGNTFLTYSNLLLDAIYDDTPHKQNRYSSLQNILVQDPQEMTSVQENLLIVIPAWNVKDEILSKIRNLRQERKDFYLVYFPELVVLPV